LTTAARARDLATWSHTWALFAQLHNTNRTEGTPALDPLKYFPWVDDDAEEGPAPPPTAEEEAMLAAYYNGQRKRGI